MDHHGLKTYANTLLSYRKRAIYRLYRITGITNTILLSDIIDSVICDLIQSPENNTTLDTIVSLSSKRISKEQQDLKQSIYAAKVMHGTSQENKQDCEKLQYSRIFIKSITGTRMAQVAEHLNCGLKQKEIAIRLSISPSTVGSVAIQLKRKYRIFKLLSKFYQDYHYLLTPSQKKITALYLMGNNIADISTMINKSKPFVTVSLALARNKIREKCSHLPRLRKA